MFLAPAALAIMQAANSEVSEYFPLQAGTVWTYETKMGKQKSTAIGRVETEATVNNEKATPVALYVDGKRVNVAYYKTTQSSVFMLAVDPSHPLNVPKEVLRLGNGDKWTWDGPEGDAVVHLEAHTAPGGSKSVLNRKVDTIKIEFDGTMTVEKTGVMLKMHQSAIYGKGIGLIQMDQEWTYDRDKLSQSMKITKFEQAAKQ